LENYQTQKLFIKKFNIKYIKLTKVSEKVIQTIIPAEAGIYITDGNTGFPFTRE
jgi:hypothetical protein